MKWGQTHDVSKCRPGHSIFVECVSVYCLWIKLDLDDFETLQSVRRCLQLKEEASWNIPSTLVTCNHLFPLPTFISISKTHCLGHGISHCEFFVAPESPKDHFFLADDYVVNSPISLASWQHLIWKKIILQLFFRPGSFSQGWSWKHMTHEMFHLPGCQWVDGEGQSSTCFLSQWFNKNHIKQ